MARFGNTMNQESSINFSVNRSSENLLFKLFCSNPSCQCDIGFEHDACGHCVDINECTATAQGKLSII